MIAQVVPTDQSILGSGDPPLENRHWAESTLIIFTVDCWTIGFAIGCESEMVFQLYDAMWEREL